MLLSRASEYGVQAMVELCRGSGTEFMAVTDLAGRLGLSPSFLSKVVNQLVDYGLVASRRGPGGGVRLSRPASRIRMIEVVEAIDGPGFLTGCVMGLHECSDHEPCPFHTQWKPARESVLNMLAGRTLAELGLELSAGGSRRRPTLRKRRSTVSNDASRRKHR